MHSIFALTDAYPELKAAVRHQGTLTWHGPEAPLPTDGSGYFWLDGQGLHLAPDWRDEAPPLLWPSPLPATRPILEGFMALQTGHWEAAAAAWDGQPALLHHLAQLRRLIWQQPVTSPPLPAPATAFEAYRQAHNHAILAHYNLSEVADEAPQTAYAQALALAPAPRWRAFTLRHWGTLLLDLDQARTVEATLAAFTEELPLPAQMALLTLQCRAGLALLQIPYDTDRLARIKTGLARIVAYLRESGRQVEMGLLLLDAAQVAQLEQHFAEALGYVNQALDLLRDEDEMLLGQVQLHKGRLLFSWAQQGQPQFCQPSIQAFQEALKVFTQAEAPAIFADIHHHLGVLYAEMPAPPEKAALWAAVSASSFREALTWFTPERDAYQYGMICNNYGNALTRYQGSERADYFQKALDFYREALSVRGPDLPYERALTLLNFLEASWKVANPEGFNHERYQDMRAKATEVTQLVDDPDLQSEAQRHLELLDQLIATVS